MKILKLFLLTLVIFSCQKDSVLVEEPDLSTIDRYNLSENRYRLAFGKTVSNALENLSFRSYLKEKSIALGTEKTFGELLFFNHQNDIVGGNVKLKDLLESYIDDETRALVGENFMTQILDLDPMIAIKIPDIFFNLNWKTKEFAPFVYVETPTFLVNEDNFNYYQGFHFSGLSEKNIVTTKPKYFGIVVKHSEDYLLLETDSWISATGVSLFEHLPQARKCIDILKPEIELMSKKHPFSERLIYIKKRSLFEKQREICEWDYPTVPRCDSVCRRDCAPNDEIFNVLENISLGYALTINSFDESLIYDDEFHVLFSYMEQNELQLNQVSIFGFRKLEFVNNYNIKYNLELEHYCSNTFGNIKLPSIDLKNYFFEDEERVTIPVNVLIRKGLPPRGALPFQIMIASYNDFPRNVFRPMGFDDSFGYEVNPSFYISPTQSNIWNCDDHFDEFDSFDYGSFHLRIKY